MTLIVWAVLGVRQAVVRTVDAKPIYFTTTQLIVVFWYVLTVPLLIQSLNSAKTVPTNVLYAMVQLLPSVPNVKLSILSITSDKSTKTSALPTVQVESMVMHLLYYVSYVVLPVLYALTLPLIVLPVAVSTE